MTASREHPEDNVLSLLFQCESLFRTSPLPQGGMLGGAGGARLGGGGAGGGGGGGARSLMDSFVVVKVQGYLAHKKQLPPRTTMGP